MRQCALAPSLYGKFGAFHSTFIRGAYRKRTYADRCRATLIESFHGERTVPSEKNVLPQIYSCRAEVPRDVVTFIAALAPRDESAHITKLVFRPRWMICKLEFRSFLDYKTIRLLIESLDDCHIMAQTLRDVPLSKNSLDRDDVYWADCESGK